MQHQINDSTSASATEWAAVCFRWHSMLWLSQKGVAVVGFNTLSLVFCSMYNQSFLATDIYYTVQGVLSNHFVCIMLFILLFFFLQYIEQFIIFSTLILCLISVNDGRRQCLQKYLCMYIYIYCTICKHIALWVWLSNDFILK